ncbi:hypothetical protein LJC16_03705, partial [Bacteroidales bacterium OttesenSCG-928-C19]|nr:hypothetical protein [Bacteroidales bacterium OttesenSCG-928-C19]
MKTKIFLLLSIFAIAFTGCDSKKYKEAQKEIASLKTELTERENESKMMFDAINDIEENLMAITEKYRQIQKIKKENIEKSKDAKTDIQNQIIEINQLLEENKNQINSLTAKLGKSDSKLRDANALVDRLNARVNEQDRQINTLLVELEKEKILVGTLTKDLQNMEQSNLDKDQLLAQKALEANIAYYAIGTDKDLRNNNIIDKQGRTRVISTDADPKNFIKINIRDIRQIPVNSKKAELVTK